MCQGPDSKTGPRSPKTSCHRLFLTVISCLLIALPGKLVADGFVTVIAGGLASAPEDLTNATAVAVGTGPHGIARRSDGTVTVWGANQGGQQAVPPGLMNVKTVAAGSGFCLALKEDGTVVAWGTNYSTSSISPPAGLTNVTAISAYLHHALALRADGSVVAWGLNDHGQTDVPAGLVDVVAVSAGAFHSLALMANGTVAAWGKRQAGNSSEEGKIFLPVEVPANLKQVKFIAAGVYFDLAIKQDGSPVTWGRPVTGGIAPPVAATNLVAVAAGYYDGVGLRSDGSIVRWGDIGGQDGTVRMANATAIATSTWQEIVAIGPAIAPRIIANSRPAQFETGTMESSIYALADGTGPLSFQWFKGESELPGQTKYYLPSEAFPTPADSGTYQVVVSNQVGSDSASIDVEVTEPGAVSILVNGQPVAGQAASIGPAAVSMGFPGFVPDDCIEGHVPPDPVRCMFFTLDGSVPTTDSPRYIEPLILLQTTTLRVMRLVSGVPVYRALVIHVLPQLILTTLGSGSAQIEPIQFPLGDPPVVEVSVASSRFGNWRFAEWRGDATGTAPRMAVVLDRPKEITAVFSNAPLNVKVIKPRGATLSTTFDGAHRSGFPQDLVRLSVTPAGGRTFLFWRASLPWNPDPELASNPLLVRDDRALVLQPVIASTVVTESIGHGAVRLAEPWETFRNMHGSTVPDGTTVQVVGLPEPGYYLEKWTVDVGLQPTPVAENPYALVINSNLERRYTLTGVFSRLPITQQLLTINLVGDGGVQLDTNRNYFPTGQAVTMTARPAPTTRFVGWSGDVVSSLPQVSLVMETNKTVTATFVDIPPQVSMTAGPGVELRLQVNKLPWVHYVAERSGGFESWDFWQDVYGFESAVELKDSMEGEGRFYRLRPD
jgi:hypothetical protein